MKAKALLSLGLFLGLTLNSSAQNAKEGTYMSLFTLTHYTASMTDQNTLRIEPCQDFESQLSKDKETYEFKRLANTDKFGWNGGTEIILAIDNQTNTLTFPNPMNMKVPVKLKLLHQANTAPAAQIKTYFDETSGGYSNARILVTDPDDTKNGNCLIHSNPTQELNQYIVGSFRGMYDPSLNATFNADNSGTFLGLPMNWSIVSDQSGNIKKGDYPSGGFIVHLMIEFENGLPVFVDKPSAGKKLAIIEGLRYSQDGTIEIRQMQRQ